MDWLNNFKDRFANHPKLQNLKAEHFHGHLKLNFCDGYVQTYDYNMHGRAVKDIEYTDVRQGPTRVYKNSTLNRKEN